MWNGLILDITDYKRAEEALHASAIKEIRYHSFFENTCNGVLIYEPIDNGNEYILKDVNKATANLLRLPKEDLIGKKLFEEFPDLPDPEIRRITSYNVCYTKLLRGMFRLLDRTKMFRRDRSTQ